MALQFFYKINDLKSSSALHLSSDKKKNEFTASTKFFERQAMHKYKNER